MELTSPTFNHTRKIRGQLFSERVLSIEMGATARDLAECVTAQRPTPPGFGV